MDPRALGITSVLSASRTQGTEPFTGERRQSLAEEGLWRKRRYGLHIRAIWKHPWKPL